jgi:hypothetical protein
MVRRRGLVSSVGLGWTSVVSDIGLCWTLVPSIGFAAGEERDGASEKGTGVGLEREMVHRRGLVAGVELGSLGLQSEAVGVGEKNEGMFILCFDLILGR